jgi:hypothetical protein
MTPLRTHVPRRKSRVRVPSRATAFTAMDDKFRLDPNTRRLFEDAGFLFF